jgi:large subunit ribosomal protein L17
MRHHARNKKFGRKRDQRRVFMNSLAEALITREKILTTEARAKALRPYVEALITKVKAPTVAIRRRVSAALGGREKAAKKLVDVLAPRFKDRKGGYTRITKVVRRSSDGHSSAVIEFV